MNNTRKFGIEIEFSRGSRQAVANYMNNNGVPCEIEHYNHDTKRHWKIVTDCSCGYELVSPPLKGEDGLNQLRVACEALQAAGADVSMSCGLHVHLDTKGLKFEKIKNFTKLYAKYEEQIDRFMPNSRRASNTHWCKSIVGNGVKSVFNRVDESETMRELSRAITGRDRYHKLNFESFWNYGTLEVRHHSGTIEYKKISEWVMFLQNMMDVAKRSRDILRIGGNDLDAMLYFAEDKTFYANRVVQLQQTRRAA